MTLVKTALNQIKKSAFEKLLPKNPVIYHKCFEEKFSNNLPYEYTILDEDKRELILMSDGALGTMWRLPSISHEILSENELDYKLKELGKIFEKLVDERLTLQVYFQKEISDEFVLPEWDQEPNTFARRVIKERTLKIKALKNGEPELQKISTYLFLRLDSREQLTKSNKISLFDKIKEGINTVNEDIVVLQNHARTIENGFLSRLGEELIPQKSKAMILLLRKLLHGKHDQVGKYFEKVELNEDHERIADHILQGSMRWDIGAIGIGEDCLEVLSWSTLPHSIYPGLMSSLLQIKGELTCVLNIRPKNYIYDLEGKAEQSKGSDPLQKRQKIQLDEVHDRVVGGEKLMHSSLHVIYRNEGVSIDDPKKLRKGKQICRDISDILPLFVEEYCCYLSFISCLPFMYSKKIAPLLARERRVPSGDLGYLLPVLSGMRGATKPKQLMQSRTGEAVWLNNRQSPTNPHFSIYGESGSGKSFFAANHLISEFAYDPDVITILVDSLTSYEFLAKSVGEDHGCQIIRPPERFPNIFYGEISPEKLPIITSTLKVAVSLISKTELTAPEEALLGDAVIRVYDSNLDSASKRYVKSDKEGEIGSYESLNSELRLPRLSDIVNVLATVAAEKSLSKEIVKSLSEKLLPFYGSGPYAKIFDQISTREVEERAPGFILYDLAEIQDDKELCTLTTIILIAETERLLKHPLNAGRSGNLIFEEAQTTLNSKNPILADYIKSAYARFRKLGWACGCIGNMIDAFSNLTGPKSAWGLSATKIVLPLSNESEQAKLPEIIKSEYYCELATSLQKIPGQYSQFLYLGNPVKGTGIYVATGHDYWLSANENLDCKAISFVTSHIDVEKPYQSAIEVLSSFAPSGFRDEHGSLREMTDLEKDELLEIIKDKKIMGKNLMITDFTPSLSEEQSYVH